MFLTPVQFTEDGWFTAGTNGTTIESYEIPGDFVQITKKEYTFVNTDWDIDWCYMRRPAFANYKLEENKAVLYGTDITLDEIDSPTFLAIRQRDFEGTLTCDLTVEGGEAGVTVYMCENEHYEVAIREGESGYEGILKLNIGGIKHIQTAIPLTSGSAQLEITYDNFNYNFSVVDDGKKTMLGSGQTKYLSSEVSGGFTGVLFGLYAIGRGTGTFTNFRCMYQ